MRPISLDASVDSGAIASPAGVAAGGLFSCRGALEDERSTVKCCRRCLHCDRKGAVPTWALTLNEWGQWRCVHYVPREPK